MGVSPIATERGPNRALSVRHELAAQTGLGVWKLGFWLPGPRPLPIEAV
jgi:hypothetical protein